MVAFVSHLDAMCGGGLCRVQESLTLANVLLKYMCLRLMSQTFCFLNAALVSHPTAYCLPYKL